MSKLSFKFPSGQIVNHQCHLSCDMLENVFFFSLIEAYWCHRSGPTMAQLMVCCLATEIHYSNQCLPIISKVQWHPFDFEGNFTGETSSINHYNVLKITYLIFYSIPSEANVLISSKQFNIWKFEIVIISVIKVYSLASRNVCPISHVK